MRPARILTLAVDDGDEGKQNAYVRCIVLEPGRSALVITLFRQFVDYAAAMARLERLLAGLDLP